MSAEQEFFEKAKATESTYRKFGVSDAPAKAVLANERERQIAEDIGNIRKNVSTITTILVCYFVCSLIAVAIIVFGGRH